jgi:hypothetical protein
MKPWELAYRVEWREDCVQALSDFACKARDINVKEHTKACRDVRKWLYKLLGTVDEEVRKQLAVKLAMFLD